jgi:putative tricarboxylic transport membrane protein
MRYASYYGGSNAQNCLLLNQEQLRSTGLGEVLKQAKTGKVRILAITAPERVEEAPEVPTLKELGYEVEFVNWMEQRKAPARIQ